MPDHPSLTAPLVPVPPFNPVETMDPYKSCWCGSGTKYKWCHHRRHEQEPINVFEVEKRMMDELRSGYCSHPDQTADPCGGAPIKAHTVQRKGGLAAIAEKGHVLTVKPTMKGLIETEGESWPRPIGTSKASVFPGFCGKHDTAIFKPVEGATLNLDQEAAFLLAYRAIAYERFAKEAQLRGTPMQRDMDRGHPFPMQAATQHLLHVHLFGVHMGLKDIERTKAAFDQRLLSGDRTGFHHLAVRFDALLPVVACAAFHVENDFAGRRLQRLGRGEAPFELVTLTVTSFQGRSVAVFGWIDDTDGPAAKFVRSFEEVPDDEKADALLRLLFVQSENLFLRPSWWEGLGGDDQKALVGQVMIGTSLKPRKPGDLASGGSYLQAGVVETSKG